jgi:hypothetical protein
MKRSDPHEAHAKWPAGADKPDGRLQSELFERASRAFHDGRFTVALELFGRAASGPAPEIAHVARLYARMCERRLARPQVQLRTPDDHYDYAVVLINSRQIEPAERHLHHALAQCKADPHPGKTDHLYYALALCRGLSGDIDGCYANLRRAIDLQPRNRSAALNDPDFAPLCRLSPVAELLYPVGKHAEERRQDQNPRPRSTGERV